MTSKWCLRHVGWNQWPGRYMGVGDGITAPSCYLLGVVADEETAQRALAWAKRRIAQVWGEKPKIDGRTPEVEVVPYDPIDFAPKQRIWDNQAHRASIHQAIVRGARDRRDELFGDRG